MWCDTFLLCRACFWLHFTFIVTDNGCKQELFRNNQVPLQMITIGYKTY